VLKKERNCQIRMSPSLWNLVGEIAQELGYKDSRGQHSAVIREMIAAGAAKWTHSPYVCRSAHHTIYVTKNGDIFFRQVQTLRLNSPREKLPCFVEMKPEKRDYYHRKYREERDATTSRRKSRKAEHPDEFNWFLSRWLFNYFAAWNGKKNPDDLDSFQHSPLSFHVDTYGTTYKSADLSVHALGGRFITREITVGLRDYVQWKEPNTPIFDRIDIPIDIPTTDLEICVIVDQSLFESVGVEGDEIANLALEFRNRESARFEGKEVALLPEIGIEELYGRALNDDGDDEMLGKVRRLRQRVSALLAPRTTQASNNAEAHIDASKILSALELPQRFLFYRLKWMSPHLGIEACVRWEKPAKKGGS